MSLEEIDKLFSLLSQCAWIGEIEKDKRKKEFEADAKNYDEEDKATFEETIDDIQKLGSNVMEVAGKFIKLYKYQLTPIVWKYLVKPFAALLDKKNKIESETIDSCCFFIDVLENLDDEIFNEYYLPISNNLFDIWDENRDKEDWSVLQSTGFGFGVIA